MEIVKKVWGYEEIRANEPEYCGKVLVIKPGYRCSLHYHKIKKETFSVLDGSVLLEQRDIRGVPFEEVLYPGDSRTIWPGTQHRFQSATNSPASLLEFSTHHEDSDSYRITESGPICPSEKS